MVKDLVHPLSTTVLCGKGMQHGALVSLVFHYGPSLYSYLFCRNDFCTCYLSTGRCYKSQISHESIEHGHLSCPMATPPSPLHQSLAIPLPFSLSKSFTHNLLFLSTHVCLHCDVLYAMSIIVLILRISG